jgi:hypothetical protein
MKPGDKVKIVSNVYGHNYIIGETYEILYVNPSNKSVVLKFDDGASGNNAGFVDIELIYNKETLKRNIGELNKEIRILRKKIEFMKKTNLEEIDDDDFKISHIIELSMDNSLSLKDKTLKVKEILINNNIVL